MFHYESAFAACSDRYTPEVRSHWIPLELLGSTSEKRCISLESLVFLWNSSWRVATTAHENERAAVQVRWNRRSELRLTYFWRSIARFGNLARTPRRGIRVAQRIVASAARQGAREGKSSTCRRPSLPAKEVIVKMAYDRCAGLDVHKKSIRPVSGSARVSRQPRRRRRSGVSRRIWNVCGTGCGSIR